MQITDKTYVSKIEVDNCKTMLQNYTNELIDCITQIPIGEYYEVTEEEVNGFLIRFNELSEVLGTDLKPKNVSQL